MNRPQRLAFIRSQLGGKALPKTWNADFEASAASLGKLFKPTEAAAGAKESISHIKISPEPGGRMGINSPRAATSLPRGKELESLTRIVERHGYTAKEARSIATVALEKAAKNPAVMARDTALRR